MKPISIPCTMININAKILLPKRIYWERDRSKPNTKGRCCVSNQRILCNNPSIFVRYPSFWRKLGFPGGTRNACKRYCAEKEKNIFYTLDTHTVHFKPFVLAYLYRKALRPHDGRRLNNYGKFLSLSTVRKLRKVKDPDASLRGIKLVTMQASGYLHPKGTYPRGVRQMDAQAQG